MSTDKPTILFVDDEERILRSLVMAFRSRYRVLSTPEGSEALHILGEEQVDVIVSDQRMPRMSGVEVLRGARDIQPATMRILLTGYSELTSIVGSINDGEIFRYVQKPWRLDELRETIDEAVGIARDTREVACSNAVIEAPPGASVVVLDRHGETARVLQAERPELHIRQTVSLSQGLALMERQPAAVLVTDLELEEGDISNALQALKKQLPELVVVVVTAFSDANHLIRLINQAQVYRVLPRPVGRNILARSVDSALRHHNLITSRPKMAARHQVSRASATHGGEAVSRVRGHLERLRSRVAEPR